LPLPGFREPVVLRAAVILRRLPDRSEPARFLETVERRKQRPRLYDERASGHLFDSPRHAQPVQFACGEGLQDQKVERPLEETFAAASHRAFYLSTSYTKTSIERFLSNVNRCGG